MKNNKPEWWENFFSGIPLDFWRQAVTEEQSRAEADFIQKVFKLPAGSRLLDVPCGNGRLSFELTARGYEVTGVDFSHEFIQEARSRATRKQLKISFEERDMRDLPWTDHFDGIFCFGNSFGYLDDAGNAEFLKSVAKALKPHGCFVLDASQMAETVLPKLQPREWMLVGDILFLEENNYDHKEGRVITEYTFVRDGKAETRTGSHRIYTYRELCNLLEAAGLKVTESYGSLSEDPFELGSQRLFFLAVKGKR